MVRFMSRQLYPREQAPGTDCTGAWSLGGHQSRSGRYGVVTILDPTKHLNSDPSVVQRVASRYTDRFSANYVWA
jgi:hypothetical protein